MKLGQRLHNIFYNIFYNTLDEAHKKCTKSNKMCIIFGKHYGQKKIKEYNTDYNLWKILYPNIIEEDTLCGIKDDSKFFTRFIKMYSNVDRKLNMEYITILEDKQPSYDFENTVKTIAKYNEVSESFYKVMKIIQSDIKLYEKTKGEDITVIFGDDVDKFMDKDFSTPYKLSDNMINENQRVFEVKEEHIPSWRR